MNSSNYIEAGQKLYIEELYKRKESGTKKVAISFVCVCVYFGLLKGYSSAFVLHIVIIAKL